MAQLSIRLRAMIYSKFIFFYYRKPDGENLSKVAELNVRPKIMILV